ncbi:MAG TPA: hypothetical protein VNE21_03145 [Mycobacteriales bacterium]|nr:hypothetical protein [Mycobacteriales bacterium]
MSDGADDPWGPRKRERFVAKLDHLVESGRVSATEAERLRAADEPGTFAAALREIRVRHAGMTLTAAVAGGTMTRAEADSYLERLRDGEHSRSLRAQLRRLLPGTTHREAGPIVGQLDDFGRHDSVAPTNPR